MWNSVSFRSTTGTNNNSNPSNPSNSSDASLSRDSNHPVEIHVRNLDAERPSTSPTTTTTTTTTRSMGWLLRLFQSEFFDAFMAITYLYRYRNTRGVHDYLCNQLYQLSDADLEAFMPQLCNLLVHHAKHSEALERFVLDKCADSMHVALQVFWFLQAAVEDASRHADKVAESRCKILRTRCETAAVNGSRTIMLKAAADSNISAATLAAEDAPFSPPPIRPTNATLFPSSSAGQISLTPAATLLDKKEKTKTQIFRTGSSGIAVVDGIDSDEEKKETVNGEHQEGKQQHLKSPSTKMKNSTEISETDDSTQKKNDMDTDQNEQTSVNDQIPITENSCDDEDTEDDDQFVDAREQLSIDGLIATPDGNSENPDTHVPQSDTDDLATNMQEIYLQDCATESTEDVNETENNENQSNEENQLGNGVAESSSHGSDNEESEKNDGEENTTSVSLNPSEREEKNKSNVNTDEKVEEKSDSAKKAAKSRSKSTNDIDDYDPVKLLTMKQERFEYFNDSVTIAKAFANLSMTTKDLPQEQRLLHLTSGLEKINDVLLRRMNGEPGIPLVEGTPVPPVEKIARIGMSAALKSVHLPLTRASSQALRILRVHSEEVVILTSRTRAPYKVNIEVLPTEMECSDKLLFCEHRVNTSRRVSRLGDSSGINEDSLSTEQMSSSHSHVSAQGKSVRPSLKTRKLREMTPAERQRANVRSRVYGDAYSEQPDLFEKAEEEANEQEIDEDSPDYKSRHAVVLGIYGELWSWKEERILRESPFRNLKGAKLLPFIVKGGDDLRQEQLAIQLIRQFETIFKEEGVDVYLRPFTMMSISSEAGFVEVISDAVSVHSLKKRAPNFVSLLDYFEKAYGAVGTSSFRAAQRRFIRSMAGYSLVTYFLQVKDRHNGNIMVDIHGHIIHIDFGFMLTNSPGAIKFESVPFKLTEEYLQVMCGKKNVLDLAEASKTEGYRYFQELFVLGLLAARKHYEKITTLVEIMSEGTTMPCMMAGHSIVESLCSRFAVGMPEEECINFALGLIEESRLSWRSAGYDRFQAYSNGYR